MPTTYLVQAELETVHHGRYGYRIEVDFPKIVNDYGSPIYGRLKIDSKWIYKGMRTSVANARCAGWSPAGEARAHLQGRHLPAGQRFKRCTQS